jgi:hypothetical protein
MVRETLLKRDPVGEDRGDWTQNTAWADGIASQGADGVSGGKTTQQEGEVLLSQLNSVPGESVTMVQW